MVDPDGLVVVDVAERLPGRGMWVTADRALLARALEKNFFSRAAQQAVRAPDDLAATTERAIEQRCLELLGLLRRSGAVTMGFDNVDKAFAGNIAAILTAADASANAMAKGVGFARQLPHVHWLSVAEMSLALGRENVVHAALAPGTLTERFLREARRLRGLRGVSAPGISDPVRTESAPAGARTAHATGLPKVLQ